MLEDAAFLNLEIQEHAGDAVPGLVVFQQPGIGLYQRLVESARNRLAELELEYGIEKSKVDLERDAPWTDCGSMPNTLSSIIKTEEFRGIKPQMNADAPKGIENADKEG